MSRTGVFALALTVLGAMSTARAQTPEERAWIERLERRYEELLGRRLKSDSVAEARYDTLRV
ncbi:MAG: hypothetical protein OEW06_18200, partial [Gemmatimonadota bacterium]|nr:hypothetical protein [Gemmatimonadota bacterium]